MDDSKRAVAGVAAELLTSWRARTAGGDLLILSHNDADGLAAAVVLERALLQARSAAVVRLVGRFEDPWSDTLRDEVARRKPAGLIVADLGVRAEPVLPGLPSLLIDHHVPRGWPSSAETLVVSGYGHEPTPSSSVLAWNAAAGLGDTAGLAWIAALGAIGDFGDKAAAARFPELWAAATANSRPAALRAATTLINAPRRSSTGDAAPALRLLRRAARALDITSGAFEETALLQAARDEVQAELRRARAVAPVFAGDVALLRMHSRCQVHPLVAQTWVQRLRNRVVIAANSGFREGFVHFAARTSGQRNLVTFLQQNAPPARSPGDTFAGGHEQASGGALSVTTWTSFARGLGFEDELVRPPFGER